MKPMQLVVACITAICIGTLAACQTGNSSFPNPAANAPRPVAGIESFTMDGQRYFFGHDFGADVVASDLYSDPAEMAAYAAQFLTQRDGDEPAEYWAELVSISVGDSFLSPSIESRTFESNELLSFADAIQYMIDENAAPPSPDSFQPYSYTIRYLISAAAFNQDRNPTDAERVSLNRTNPEGDWQDNSAWHDLTDELAQVVRGQTPRSTGVEWRDIGLSLQYYGHQTDFLTGRWRAVFSPLIVDR